MTYILQLESGRQINFESDSATLSDLKTEIEAQSGVLLSSDDTQLIGIDLLKSGVITQVPAPEV